LGLLTGLAEKIALFWKRRYGGFKFRLVDFNCLGYLSLIGLLLFIFHEKVENWAFYFILHGVLIVSILETVRAGEKNPQRKLLWIMRTFYPVVVILFGWGELDALVPMVFGNYWATDSIIRLDKLVFRVHPTLWFQGIYRPWLDELMTFFYSGYYLFMPVVILPLYLKGRREETFAAFSMATFTYFSNYCLFYLFPTLAPNMTETLSGLNNNHYTGYFFAEVTRLIQANGAVRGGTFPSSHISAVLVWSLVALRYERVIGYFLMPMAFGVAFSTVYLGYHHAADPFFGFIWGAICYPIALRLLKLRKEEPLSLASEKLRPNDLYSMI